MLLAAVEKYDQTDSKQVVVQYEPQVPGCRGWNNSKNYFKEMVQKRAQKQVKDFRPARHVTAIPD